MRTRYSDMKGQSGTVLLVAVTLGVLLSGFVALALTQQLPPIFANKVNDAAAITDAETRADYLINGYLEQSAKFSFFEAALKIGNMTMRYNWDSDGISYGSGHGGYSGSSNIEGFYGTYFDNVEFWGRSYFNDYIDQLDSSSPKCEYVLPGDEPPRAAYRFYVVRTEPQIKVNTTNNEPMVSRVDCRRTTVRAAYEVNADSIRMSLVRTHIHNMAVGMTRGMKKMWNEAMEIKNNDNWNGQVSKSSTCKTDSGESGVESTVENRAQNEADQRIQDLLDRIHDAGVNGIQSASGETSVPLLGALVDLIKKNFDTAAVDRLDYSVSVSKVNSQTQWTQCNNQCETHTCPTHYTYSGGSCVASGSVSNDCHDQYHGRELEPVPGPASGCQVQNPPGASCSNYERKYEATYDYALEKVLYYINLKDETVVPTSLNPNTRIPLQRHWEFNFRDTDSNAYDNTNYRPLN